MSRWRPSPELRRKYKLTPYQTEDGKWVRDHLAWRGHCSGCGQEMYLTVGIDRSAVALLYPGSTYNVVESSYDDHPCKAQPYRLKRPYDPASDMAHPITDARFVPSERSELFDMGCAA